jgi:hypothetical protein
MDSWRADKLPIAIVSVQLRSIAKIMVDVIRRTSVPQVMVLAFSLDFENMNIFHHLPIAIGIIPNINQYLRVLVSHQYTRIFLNEFHKITTEREIKTPRRLLSTNYFVAGVPRVLVVCQNIYG